MQLCWKLLLNGSLLFIIVTASFDYYHADIDDELDDEDFEDGQNYFRKIHEVEYVEDDLPVKDNLKEHDLKCDNKAAMQDISYPWESEDDYYRLINFKHVVPLHYDLELTIPGCKDYITVSGKSTIKLEIRKPTRVITFHYAKPQDLEVRLFHKNGEICVNKYICNTLLRIVRLIFNAALQPGLYTLKMKFPASSLEVAGIEIVKHRGHRYLMESFAITHLQPFTAQQLFPCFDEPTFESTFNITINHCGHDKAISNMPHKTTKYWRNNHDLIQTRFSQTPAIPAYRVVLMLATLDYVNSNNLSERKRNYDIWFRMFARVEVEYAEKMISKISPKYDWKESINLESITHIVLPHAEKRYYHGYLGVCVYTEADIFYHHDLDPVARKIEVLRVIGHALADQWFTNHVVPSWWSDLWLNKGITELLSLDVLNETFPELRMIDLFVVQTQHESLHLDTENIMKPLTSNIMTRSEINSLFSFPFYMKAPVVMRMLQHILPDGILHRYIILIAKAYYTYIKPRALTETKFWEYLGYALESMKLNIILPHGKTNDFAEIIEPWIKLKHYPLVNVERNYETAEIKLSQKHFQEENVDNVGTWWIPIAIAKQTDANFTNTEPLIWLNPSNKQETIKFINESGWIILNPQQSGYYRVNYDVRNWMLIADYLNSDNYKTIHVLNRAQIIDDAYHLLMIDQLDYKIFLRLTEYLSRETDYIPWYPMFKSFEYFSGLLPYVESTFLKGHMLKILNGLLVNIGYQEEDNETDIIKSLRQEAIKWACILKSTVCIEKAEHKLQEYMKEHDYDHFQDTMVNGWKDWMYRNGIARADMNTWNRAIDYLLHQKNYEQVLQLLSCSENPIVIHETVKLMFIEYAKKKEDRKINKPLRVISSIFAKHARNMLQDILTHLEGENEHIIIKILAVTIHHVYTADHLDMIHNFVYHNLKNKEAIQDLLKMRLLQINVNRLANKDWFKSKSSTTKITMKKDSKTAHRISKEVFKSPARNFLLDNILPLHYDIKLKIPKHIKEANFTFDGECNVKIVIHSATQMIGLHSLEQKIYKASLTPIKRVANDLENVQVHYCTKFAHNSTDQILILHFEVMLFPGNYILNVKFVSSFYDNGNGVSKSLYKNGNGNGNRVWLFTTRSQPIRARQVFPCWDEPTLKTTFNISINHDPKYRLMSNMPIINKHMENGTIWTYFDITPTMTTYHMAMAITMKDLYRISNIKKNINMWGRALVIPYLSFAHTVAETVMQDLVRYTGTLKIPKMDHLAIPEIQEEAIGNWGLNIYKEEAIIYDPELDSIARKMNAARLVARAVAHQLLNNVTNLSWSSHPWLNEGLPTFLGTYAIDKNFICPRAMDLFVVQLQHESLHLDTHYNMQPLMSKNLSDIQSLFSFPFYTKAPVIVRMLQQIISNILFIQGEIYTSFESKILTPYDMSDAMETALKKLDTKHSDYILKNVMDTWTEQSNYPVLNVTRDYSNGHVTISQENFSFDEKKWWIPVTYATQAKPYFSNILSIRWLEPRLHNIILDGIDENTGWVIVNLQQTGYYRVNYDRTNWKLISNYLNSEEYKNIHILNRAQIIDDAYHLLMANQLELKIFLDLTEYLSQETDYIAWYPMIKALEYLSGFLPYKESQPLKHHMIKILRALLAKIGYDEYPKENDLTKCLRQEAVKWACTLGDINCKIIAKHKLEEYLENPTKKKFLPGWKHWTYCAGLTIANSRTWNKAWDMSHMKKSDKVLELLSCSEIFTITRDALEIMLSETNNTIQNNKRANAMYSLIAKHARNNLESVLMQLKKYNIRYITKALIIIINHVYSESQLNKVNEFIRSNIVNKETTDNIQYMIERRLDQIKYHTNKFSIIFTKNELI